MKLAELDPKLSDTGILRFDCPACLGTEHQHAIRIALVGLSNANVTKWDHQGTFPDTLTLEPSIDAGCWHGHIRNGEITP